jgi:hypothetical protein
MCTVSNSTCFQHLLLHSFMSFSLLYLRFHPRHLLLQYGYHSISIPWPSNIIDILVANLFHHPSHLLLQRINDAWFCQGRYIPEIICVSAGDFPENSPHDLARACFRKPRSDHDLIGRAEGTNDSANLRPQGGDEVWEGDYESIILST